jgi:predicted transcriptional regulator
VPRVFAERPQVSYTINMTAKALKEVLQRVEAWPEHAQDMLADLALEIDRELHQGMVHATPAELEGIDRGLKAANEGRLVGQGKIEALLVKHRPK